MASATSRGKEKKKRTKKNEKASIAKKTKKANLAHLGKQTKVPRRRVSGFGSFFFGGIILNWLELIGATFKKKIRTKKNEKASIAKQPKKPI